MLPRKIFDKNDAIWCILTVPKLVIIKLNSNIFLIINRQPTFCAIFFSKINPYAHFGTKTNTFAFYKGGGGGGLGGNRPQKPKKCKKQNMEALHFFLHQIQNTRREDISCNDMDSD